MVIAKAEITLYSIVDISKVTRYYILKSSTASKPSAPTSNPPTDWTTTEPSYTSGSTNTLYFVDLTEFTNGTFAYSAVSKSSSYEAAKEAYNKAANAQNGINNLEIGGRNLLMGTETPLYIDYTEEAITYQSSKVYSLNDEILADPKAFLLSLENSYLAFSYDIEIESIVADPEINLNRVGGYFTFNITDITTENPVAWYGTHSAGIMVSNNSIGSANSLISVGSEPISFIGHYAGYCDMSNGSSILRSFYANPDNYTVTATSAYVEIRGSTTGGVIKNVKLEVGNKPTRWTPAPEDTTKEISRVEAAIDVLDKKIITTVTDEYGNTSLVQTGSNWDFNLGRLEERIEGVESKTSHIQVTEAPDDDGSDNKIPALVLFEDDQTTFKSVFTNKYLNFVYAVKQDDGTTEDTTPTRMTTTGMETEDMTINKNLNHVGFQWRKRANGNYGLSWIGGDE